MPYALKAADADTLGGKPFSAFVLAGNPAAQDPGISPPPLAAQRPAPVYANNGLPNYIGKFFSTTELDNSALYQSGSSIGLGTPTPAGTFEVRKDQNATTVAYITNGDARLLKLQGVDQEYARYYRQWAAALKRRYCDEGTG